MTDNKKGRPVKYPHLIEKMFKLKADGFTDGEIARALNVPRTTINYYLRKVSVDNS